MSNKNAQQKYDVIANKTEITQVMDAIDITCLEQDMAMMKGVLRPTARYARCSKCRQPYLHIFKFGFVCVPCNTHPKGFLIDLHWEGHRYRICSHRGKPFDKYGPAFNLLSIIQGEIDDGTFDPSKYAPAEAKKFNAGTLLDVFLQEKLKVIAPSYRSGYKKQVKLQKQLFRNLDVRETKKKDSVAYLQFLKTQKKADGKPLRAKTILNYYDNFKTFFNHLKTNEIIRVLPEFPSKAAVDDLMEELLMSEEPFHYTWFHSEEQISILDMINVKEDRDIEEFLMLHGCRPGEARALRVADVNIDNLSIIIKNTYSKNTFRPRRKGKKSKPYVIPLHPEMVDFFRERVKNPPETFIFLNPKTGQPYKIDAFQNIFASVRSKLNIPKVVRFYDASRHSFVSQLRQAGVPLSEISKIVGHSSEKITETVYNHADDVDVENKRMAISKLSLRKPTEIVDIRAIS
ncbi:MAG: tyrosine-type recombinase/integrase [Dissulfurispiraceae bacterium]